MRFHALFAALLVALLSLSAALTAFAATPAQQAYVKASNTDTNDQFGIAVAVWGGTMVVGAYSEASNATGVDGVQGDNSAARAGAVYIFVRSGSNWVQQAYLKASNAEAEDLFGSSVAIYGDSVVVGAPWEGSNATGVNGNQNNNNAFRSGAAYVFVRVGTNWIQQAYLKASNSEANDGFGQAVALSGDTIVVSALDERSNATGVNGNQSDNSVFVAGAAYVFVRSGTNWSQQAYLKASNTETQDFFGSSVALSADTIVVGATQEDSSAAGVNGNQNDNSAGNSGAAYVFVRDGTNWSQQAYLKASNPGGTETATLGDQFGTSVAVSGQTIIVGAKYESSSATGVNGDQANNSALLAGAAYVFVRNGTNWSQQAYLKASNTDPLDRFGHQVAVGGETAVVSAYFEGSSASGVNGDQSNNGSSRSGAAYVYVRTGTNWVQQAYLKASNPGPNDRFGSSVSVSSDTVVVGAYQEDSNATGVNNNQNDNGAADSGAVYIFKGLGHGPRIMLEQGPPVWPGGPNSNFINAYNLVPGFSYRLERATSLGGTWETIQTLNAGSQDHFEFQDFFSPVVQAFYRVVQE